MSRIFETREKSGRIIYLTNERWKHIVAEHPVLANKIEDIKNVLCNPLAVRNSKYDENIRYYYKYHKNLRKFLMVSAKYLNGEGFIITAFYTRKMEK